MKTFLALTFVLISLLAGYPKPVQALPFYQQKDDGGQAGAFLDFAASARSVAMGHAFTAVADDAGAGYWNAAGLTQLDRKDIVALYSSLQQQTGYGFFSFAQPTLDHGSFGFSLVNLRSSFEKKSDPYTVVGGFDESETALLLSYGNSFADKWSAGGTLKVLQQKIDRYSGNGYGADAGLMVKIHPKFQAGLNIKNLVAPKITLISVPDKYPRSLTVGFKYEPRREWMFTSDVIKNQNQSLKMNLGMEWKAADKIALRAGLTGAELTAGLGFQFRDWGIDYAFGYQQSPSGVDSLGGSHRFGFHMKFGQTLTDLGATAKWQKEGQLVLEILEEKMDNDWAVVNEDLNNVLDMGERVIRHQGYVRPEDLYQTQGYIYFFKKDYARSVQALMEALELNKESRVLPRHLAQANQKLSDEKRRNEIARETEAMKDAFKKKDYRAVVRTGNKILSLNPAHAEASQYLAEATRLIQEPIISGLKSGIAQYENGEYLEAIGTFLNVIKLDPENAVADKYVALSREALDRKSIMNAPAVPAGSETASGVFEVSANSAKSRQLYSQGLLLYSQGKLKEALVLWEKSVHLDQTNELAFKAYYRAMSELEEIDKSPRPVPQRGG